MNAVNKVLIVGGGIGGLCAAIALRRKGIEVDLIEKKDYSRLAEYDSLTGLANRHRMTRRLESTLSAYKAAKRS